MPQVESGLASHLESQIYSVLGVRGMVLRGAYNLWGLCSDVNRPGTRLSRTCGEVGAKSKELIRRLDLV
jgi:hypothetical protein